MTKTVDTLVSDIYALLETKEIPEGVDLKEQCDEFGRRMGELLLSQIQPDEDRRGLRLSGVGKPDRQIYNAYHSVGTKSFGGPTYIKFLYGHIIEELLLTLTRISGHTVSDEQKEVRVEGVKGHMDGRIDGVLMDVKSCSSYGFKKFKNNTLHKDDPFGYIGQLKAYAYAEGDTTYGWLAMDKQNGTLAWLQYHEDHDNTPYKDAVDYDIAERVRYLKSLVSGDLVPTHCYDPVPEGKSGNMRLGTGCSYCDFRSQCWPELRTYYYATGPKHFTKVVKEPKVPGIQVPDEF